MDKPTLKIIGKDSNAFNLLGLAQRAGSKAGWSKEKIEAVIKEAMSGDYDNLIRVLSKHFDVC